VTPNSRHVLRIVVRKAASLCENERSRGFVLNQGRLAKELFDLLQDPHSLEDKVAAVESTPADRAIAG
jgi:hypothetical protein